MVVGDIHVLRQGGLTARVKAAGAELCSLQNADGQELVWQAGPEWPRHAPVLFPIVGRMKEDRLSVDGETFRMTQHGFARDRTFAWMDAAPDSCRLALADDAESRAIYPFGFRLEIAYRLDAHGLSVRYAVSNTGPAVLPASLGAHPAFVWPLVGTEPKEAHRLTFERDETEPVWRLTGGLLRPQPEPTPIAERRLALHEALFADDAIILLDPNSRSVRFEAPGHLGILISWDGFKQLGIWSKPGGAGFLCIEPWHGFASPEGFDGPFDTKPGLMHIPPGEQRELGWRVDVSPGQGA
ncbi:MAG: aldose 1-epimerase family protein [Acetobacteraceae bacterium]|nr:aldose 1-epimerase family protein [Acetobacteraceae bacterium]